MVAFGFVALGVGLLIIWPCISNIGVVGVGFESLYEQKAVWQRTQQILLTLLPAMIAAVSALQLVIWLRSSHGGLLLLFVLPGLCGSLFLSLTLLNLFQLPGLHLAYDTWLPMMIGQTLFAVPRALLLVVLLEVIVPASSVKSASLLMSADSRKLKAVGNSLLWQLINRRWLLATAVLTHWCFWDVAIVSTLRPVTFEPIVTRLYNEMHWGRAESLVAMTLMALFIPIAVFICVGLIWQRIPKQRLKTNG